MKNLSFLIGLLFGVSAQAQTAFTVSFTQTIDTVQSQSEWVLLQRYHKQSFR